MFARTLLLMLICGLTACSCDQASADPSAKAWPAFDAPDPAPVAETQPARPLPRACALITEAQAAQVLNDATSLMSDDPEACVWASAGHPGQITMLMVLISESENVAMAQDVFSAVTGMPGNLSTLVNQQINAKTKKSGQELDDLGDEAWLSGSNTDLIGTQQLVVRKGTRMLTVNVTGMGNTDGLAMRLEAFAREAVPQL